jgi:hypothetical protein
MLIDIHVRNADGSPGRLYDTVDREPNRNHRNAIWATYAGEEWPVLTGVRAFIVVPQEKLDQIKRRTDKGARSK